MGRDSNVTLKLKLVQRSIGFPGIQRIEERMMDTGDKNTKYY